MGFCCEAKISYGFVLKGKKAKKLIAVLTEDADEDSDVDYEHWSTVEAVTEWLERDKELELLFFDVDRNYNEGKFELAFTFKGHSDRAFEFEPVKVQVWGSDGGDKFQAIPESELGDQGYINAAKEAFQNLKDNKVFKKAGITDIVPQWILKVSAG